MGSAYLVVGGGATTLFVTLISRGSKRGIATTFRSISLIHFWEPS
jgi:hypothetical protein